ncbi:TIGR02569 family protein [Patescibacteria group bacterium]|nr:TIGR02569 family protein [Patescibacteria group bacterium]
MKHNLPNQIVLEAFEVSGKPIRLKGGGGTCYRVDDIVLKPTKDIVVASWIAKIYDNLKSDEFRIPKPIRAKDNSWVYNGWTANKFVEGKHEDGNYDKAIKLSKIFHKALLGISKPTFFDNRNDIWAIADRIAWEELPPPDFELTNKPLRKIFGILKKNELPNQLIHGDWGTGNILFSKELGPAIIDFSPYWRPADFAIAVMIVDALVYEGADKSIIDLCSDIQNFDQLLLRALVRRICEYIGHQNHPENDHDRSDDIIKHLNIMEPIINA